MTFREIYKLVLDKLKLKEGDRATDNLIKTAINQAYMEFVNLIPETYTADYGDIDGGVLYLPSDVLDIVSVYHEKYGKLNKSQYKRMNNKIKLANYIPCDDYTLTLEYIPKPSKLVNDADIPKIPEKFHIGLYYFALYIMTDQLKYLNLYNDVLNNAKSEEIIEEETFEEAIRDTYSSTSEEDEVVIDG